jgi:hypothetical protein
MIRNRLSFAAKIANALTDTRGTFSLVDSGRKTGKPEVELRRAKPGQKSAWKLNLKAPRIRKHCPRCVHAGPGQDTKSFSAFDVIRWLQFILVIVSGGMPYEKTLYETDFHSGNRSHRGLRHRGNDIRG